MLDPISSLPTRPPGAAPATPGAANNPAVPASETGAADFASLIGEAVSSLAQTLRSAEQVSVSGIKGTASMQDVVETVMSAEQSLQAAIAVRDKIVSAYLEISRMAI
ncbi:MAG: flagellar hook-basal body complex protein FliE [Hyphomicrobiaceae bacterium]|nr:flagellar hook-basal body complex protein FliE [Hyphomicrobiaceae bacterium]